MFVSLIKQAYILNIAILIFQIISAQKQAQIKHLSNQTDTLYLYGPNMVSCVQEVERNRHKFTELPRGPLGNY